MLATTIRTISAEAINLPLTEPFAIASGSQAVAANVLIKIELADGTLGLGEAAPFPAVSGETQASTLIAVQALQASLLGADVRAWRKLALMLNQLDHEAAAARCGLEMAMLDALTRHYKVPLHIFFGGMSQQLETDMTITAGDEAHAAASAKAIVARGINVIKVKTAGEHVGYDLARVRAIHQAAPHAPLIVDGNCGYNLERALAFCAACKAETIPLTLFEQPLPREDWAGMAKLSAQAGIAIAADESARSASDVLRIAREGTATVINIKLMKAGVAEALNMIAIAEAAGLGLMIGGMVESILAMSFSANLAAGNGNFQFVDLDTPLFIAEHPFVGGFEQAGGRLTLPAVAGHGVDLA
ncbi:dipeptide epimerase [Herpetosiphon geysericola]|uniref:Dipeptide epimerase n=1 Tax=Herpetosiphon geysericola TaxID=70996 RepID=A0A0P6XJF5_9CHLR|nr:dipeptide epimerase [Herpetosiphon geysericola]KPL83675.1 mandelate racemase [Herpetosiphon geysericola]